MASNGVMRRLARNRPAMAGLVAVCLLGSMAVFAPVVTRYDPNEQHLDAPLAAPSAQYWLGTDQLGRDQYSRLVYGARVSLTVGVFSQAIAVALGVAVGVCAGTGGRWADTLLMRVTDVAYAFPDLLLVILLVSVFGQSMLMLTLAIAFVSWMTIARLVRGQMVSLQNEEYVLAARAVGAPAWRVAWRHLLPATMGPVIVTAAFGIPAAIFAEAGLAFIGLGLAPPTATWGRLVTDSFDTMFAAPYLTVSACLAIALTMLSFTFLGDGLRDALDPRTTTGRSLHTEDDQRSHEPAIERRAA